MATQKLVIANWKMELSHRAALEALRAILNLAKEEQLPEMIISPSFPSLQAVAEAVASVEGVGVAAQNVHWEERGAWTGEVSVQQLRDFVQWCIVGHSERRSLVGETDEQVARKIAIVQQHGIVPIVCVGETQAEHEAGETTARLTQQMATMLTDQHRSSLSKLVIAYEPIWAIGTGAQPEPDELSEALLLIRKLAAEAFDAESAAKMRVLYGGSVNAKNIDTIAREPGVDGVLVGGASIHPRELIEIAQAIGT